MAGPHILDGDLTLRAFVSTDHNDERNAALQESLNQAIFGVMEGRDTPEMTAAAQAVIDAFRAHHVDGIILGCTEIPLLLKAAADAPDLINPAQLLAEAAVREALE